MRYFGGKSRICKDIATILNENRGEGQIFLSPFVGGGWVEQYIKGPKVLVDKHKYLISMYLELQKGWMPPTTIAKEEYLYIKDNPDKMPHLTGFVGFGCSHSGKWFGGYAKDGTGRNYCLNAHNSLIRKIENGLLDGSKFICSDYRDLNPRDYLIYCDPPYKGTTQYDREVVGYFDHNEFWKIMREWSQHNKVFISEYNAPEDFKLVWEKNTKLDMKSNRNQDRVERLFTL